MKYSGCPGVTWIEDKQHWRAYISYNGRQILLCTDPNKRYTIAMRKKAEREVKAYEKEVNKLMAKQFKELKRNKRKSISSFIKEQNLQDVHKSASVTDKRILT